MRTTLALDDDVVEMLRVHSVRLGVSLGAAASDLMRKGSLFQLRTRSVNGLPAFDVPSDFPMVTDEMVKRLSAEE